MPIKDWNTLREVAGQGYSDGIVCLATISTIERSNRPSVYEPLNVADAGRAARLLVDSALTRLHIFVCRGFAPVRHEDDLHLRAAIEFLREPGRLDEESMPDRRKNLALAVELFDKASADPRLTRLIVMRNKLIAHMARFDEAVFTRPTYDDLFGFSRQTTQIWERLSFGTGTMMIHLEDQVKAYTESADAFWSKWETATDMDAT